MELATTREVSRPTAVTERWDRRVLRAVSWVRWKFDGPPLSRLRRQLPLKGEPFSDSGFRNRYCTDAKAQSRRGGYHPPAKPIAACGKLECHSEAMKWPWNLTDYGMPIALQRLINTCHPERSRRVCRLRYGCVYCQRWKLTILYRNRKDSPIRGRCHAAVGGSE